DAGAEALGADAEAVAAVARRASFVRGAVPTDSQRRAGRDVVAVEAAHGFPRRVDDVDLQVVLGLGAVDFETHARVADAVEEGLARVGVGREERERAGARCVGGRGAGWAAGRGRASRGGPGA